MTYSNTTGYPSVSDILSPYVDKSWFTDESRLRGDAVHAAAAAYLLGLYSPPVAPEYQGYVDSIKRWIDEMVTEVVLVEKRLVDTGRGYCGKPDAIVRLKGDQGLSLPDWKTGQSQLKVWRYANVAYRRLAQIEGIETSRGFAVRPKKDGSGILPIQDYGMGSFARDWNVFLGVLNAYKALIEK
ncbi:MAG: hypothetical protein WC836_22375 [Desulfobacula sp.]|jgi:hypothetical protein